MNLRNRADFLCIYIRSSLLTSAEFHLKLVHTNLNYCELGTSTATIFFSNDFTLYAPIYLGWTSCLISVVCDHSSCQECTGSEKIQNENFLPTVGLKPTTLRFEVWCSNEPAKGVDESCNIQITLKFIHTCTSDTTVYIVMSSRMMK